jgi:single-strand DNA-binding protein
MDIAVFSIAHNTKYTSSKKISDGSYEKEVHFFDCTAFKNQAKFITQYLRKGSSVTIQGKLKQERWDDKTTGAKRSKITIMVDVIQSHDKKGEREEETTSE